MFIVMFTNYDGRCSSSSFHDRSTLPKRISVHEGTLPALLHSAQILNLNDAPQYYYFGNQSRLSQYAEYATTIQAGIRYSFGN